MEDHIHLLQQMLAESKFVEAQKLSEVLIQRQKSGWDPVLIEIYLNSMQAQNKSGSEELIYYWCRNNIDKDHHKCHQELEKLESQLIKNHQSFLELKIQINLKKGLLGEVYENLKSIYAIRIEKSQPVIPSWLNDLRESYYPNDFYFKLQECTLSLMRNEIELVYQKLVQIIEDCFESKRMKEREKKFLFIVNLLGAGYRIYHLEIIKNYFWIYANGIQEKKDYKKILEMVLYFEEFKLQVFLLHLLVRLKLEDEAELYATEIKKNKDYSYVYLDKYFPELKKYFLRKINPVEKTVLAPTENDLAVEMNQSREIIFEENVEKSEEENLLIATLSRQEFRSSEAIELAVSLIHLEYFFASFEVAKKCWQMESDLIMRRKLAYLMITCLFKMGDFRKIIDLSVNSINDSENKDEILSFMYTEAEARFRLGDFVRAKSIFSKIHQIAPGYRQVSSRLETIDAL